MKEDYIDVDGWRTRYVRAGERGPALVLLHGLGASLESWWFSIDPLANAFRVFAPDIVYFGKSAKPTRAPTDDDFVYFTRKFMDALRVERAVLVGNSMGGAIAARTALVSPERVAALVLVNAAGFGREVAWWLRLRATVNLKPNSNPPDWMVRLGARAIFQNPTRVPMYLIKTLIEIGNDPETYASARRVLRLGVDWRGLKPRLLQEIRDAAHQIHAPTLIVWGKQDRVVPVKHAFIAREKIPHAQLHLFERCGHTPQLEYPQEFNALVHEFADKAFAA